MSDVATGRAIPTAAPFSANYGLRAPERLAVGRMIEAAGLRWLPYRFGSALAVVSDVDASNRDRYAGYIGMLVEELGFDFGDSTWLLSERRSLGFFSPHLSLGRSEPSESYTNTRTFTESVAEFHKGNIDHFHAFSRHGPRVAVIDDVKQEEDGSVQIEVGRVETRGRWRCGGIFVFGLCIVGLPGRPIAVQSVTMRSRDGRVITDCRPTPYPAPPDEREYRLFAVIRPPEDEAALFELEHVHSVTIQFDPPEHAANVQRVLLIGTLSALLIDRLAYLRDRYNIETSLITDHVRAHFRNPASEPIVERELREHMKRSDGMLAAYNGRLYDDDNFFIFSTDADDPHSFARVFPELRRDLECRFIVPIAARSALGWDLLDLVTPSPTRAGGGIYWAQRTLPNMEKPPPGRRSDGQSRQNTFVGRISRVLKHTADRPGLFWPVYTHLGSLEKWEESPRPYFEAGPLHALQDRIFNMSGDVPLRSRLWFARATTLYDYALVLPGVAAHSKRPDANTIRITSWRDPVLDQILPRTPAQLYGLTFYVEDPAKAEIWLDGERITAIVRNPCDETGRASVTIAECDIHYTLFDRLDPLANASAEAELEGGGRWQWIATAEDRPFGRLTVGPSAVPVDALPAGRAFAELDIPLHGWMPTGAQLLSFDFRADDGTDFAVLFRTRRGGVFLFGDQAMAKHVPGVTAAYFIDPRHRTPGEWNRLTLPFHDLAWHPNAGPGGPMPNHPLANLTILCAASPGSGISIGRLEFLRPRAMAKAREVPRRCCVGGCLPAFRGNETVYLESLPGGTAPPRSVTIDQCGHFCFDRVSPGIYKLWSPSFFGDIYDRRGPLIEVGGDLLNLVLDRSGRSGPPSESNGTPGNAMPRASGADLSPRESSKFLPERAITPMDAKTEHLVAAILTASIVQKRDGSDVNEMMREMQRVHGHLRTRLRKSDVGRRASPARSRRKRLWSKRSP